MKIKLYLFNILKNKKIYIKYYILNNLVKYRNFKISDIEEILEIYNYYILNELNNFEEKPFKYNDFHKLTQLIIKLKLPFIVCEKNKKIVGFAFLNKFRNKSGYKYSFENSIYLDKNFIKKGIGNILLKKLLESAVKKPNICSIVAVIGGIDSKSSVKIHKKNGFKMIGTLKNIGYKKNQWLNTIYMQLVLNEKN